MTGLQLYAAWTESFAHFPNRIDLKNKLYELLDQERAALAVRGHKGIVLTLSAAVLIAFIVL